MFIRWCVSDFDYNLLIKGFDLDVDRVYKLVNGIEASVSSRSFKKQKQISFMSRKNKLDSSFIVNCLSRMKWLKDWSIVDINNMTHSQVLDILSETIIFLSFGHPEGFGLPVAEAFASKCCCWLPRSWW